MHINTERSVNQLRVIESDQLRDVTGGTTLSPAVPVIVPNMGAPKYSAQWWDIVRARGLDR